MTNEELAKAVARLTTINVVRGKDIDDMQSIIRQLWAERERQRAVMAQAKPVEAGCADPFDDFCHQCDEGV